MNFNFIFYIEKKNFTQANTDGWGNKLVTILATQMCYFSPFLDV